MTKRSKTTYTILSVGCLAVIAGAAVLYFNPKHTTTKPAAALGLPKAPVNSEAPAPGSASPAPAPAIPKTSTPHSSTSGVMTITSPTQGDTVQNGSTVSGTANIAAGQLIYYQLKGVNSGQLASGQFSASGSNYSFALAFSNEVKGSSDQGTLEVYTLDGSGAESNIASVNVIIQ